MYFNKKKQAPIKSFPTFKEYMHSINAKRFEIQGNKVLLLNSRNKLIKKLHVDEWILPNLSASSLNMCNFKYGNSEWSVADFGEGATLNNYTTTFIDSKVTAGFKCLDCGNIIWKQFDLNPYFRPRKGVASFWKRLINLFNPYLTKYLTREFINKIINLETDECCKKCNSSNRLKSIYAISNGFIYNYQSKPLKKEVYIKLEQKRKVTTIRIECTLPISDEDCYNVIRSAKVKINWNEALKITQERKYTKDNLTVILRPNKMDKNFSCLRKHLNKKEVELRNKLTISKVISDNIIYSEQ